MRSFSPFHYSLPLVFLLASLPFTLAQPAGRGGMDGNRSEFARRGAPGRFQFPPQPSDQRTFGQVVLSGTVKQVYGSPPPFGAVVEMECRGEILRRSPVDSNGYFSFRVGEGTEPDQVIPDASRNLAQITGSSNTPGRSSFQTVTGSAPAWNGRNVLGCTVHALLNSYRSTAIVLREEPVLGQNEIGTIVIYPYLRLQEFSVSVATLLTPKTAKRELDQAQRAIQKGDFDQAEKSLRSAIEIYPKYAEASFLLGEIYEKNHRAEEARGFYYDAVKADPMFVNPYMRLIQLAAQGKRWKEAADLSDTLLKLDPVGLLECYFINALAHLNLNELDLAERRAAEAQRIDFSGQFPQFCLIRASIFSLRKNSTAALSELRHYLQIAPNASNATAVKVHIYQLEKEAQMTGK
jgi:hypothetical protein